jgi:hypothetical protein
LTTLDPYSTMSGRKRKQDEAEELVSLPSGDEEEEE